jgi:hypothetical protein
MIKSLVALFVCSWAWSRWQGRGVELAVKDEGVRNAVKKAGGLAPDPVITWDFPYMSLSSSSQNSDQSR